MQAEKSAPAKLRHPEPSRGIVCIVPQTFFYILFLISCGMPTPTHIRAKIHLKSKTTTKAHLLESEQPTPFAPIDIADFTCYFVNIMGPGIGNWDRYENGISSNPGSSYFYLFSKAVSGTKGSIIEIDVPNGKQRIFQALGIRSTKVCPRTITASNLADASQFKGVFEVGRVVLDVQEDVDVKITSSYDAFVAKDARILLMPKFATIDTEVPVPGSIIQGSKNNDSISLTWTQATDNATPSTHLLYKLLSSTSVDSINTVEKAEAAGLVVEDWTLAMTSFMGTYANGYIVYTVLVKDAAGNIAQYTPLEIVGVPELSYDGVSGALTLGVAATLTPSTLKTYGAAITSCSVKSGSGVRLPSWATLNSSTCVISGTPNALLSSMTITIVATNSAGSSEGASIVLSVRSP